MEKLLKVKEVSRIYKISVFTIYKWTSLGLIPHIKLKGAIRFKESDLLKWEEENVVRHLSIGVPTTKLL